MNFWVCLLMYFSVVKSFDNVKFQYYLNLIANEQNRAFKGSPKVNAYEYAPITNKWEEYGVFDHIIIGAGSAGAVVANRLSEDAYRNVLLVEAGGKAIELTNIPGMMPLTIGLENNWNYSTVPQTTACLGMKNKQCPYARGKGLGGSSSINGGMHTRGNKKDFDNWHKEGNWGWSYNDVLPLFKKSEKFLYSNSKNRGTNGYLNVVSYNVSNPISQAFFDAHRELGMNVVDYNDIDQIGIGKPQLNILDGKRHSTYEAFLEPVLYRPNLHVSINSFVIKVLIDKKRKAFGVLFSKNKKLYMARSRHDIILSGGTIGSAQILMLSGIGPKQHLTQIGIPVVQDLPVGNNVQEHAFISYFNFVTNYTQPIITVEKLLQEYLNSSSGLLTNAFNVGGLAFHSTKLYDASYPDIEFVIMPPSPIPPGYLEGIITLNDETYKLVSMEKDFQNVFSVFVVLLHPKSRGKICLQSSNPFDYPLIDIKMLSDNDNADIETLYQGIQVLLKLVNSNALKKFDARLKRVVHPNCKQYKYLSREFWYCHIRQYSGAMFHPVGSCKMGKSPEMGAVVNPELKVYGIKNLRVADASIMPSITSGHTHAPAVMIGEKVAEMIRNN
ncbi:hypothetical protein RN001_004159 [Aquatica leii]|uniref:Glucose dehydrogenase [FAD, quinone]-like n=1 Tax=Aquatica leii TaxID=1421715 RepID=A0AAN7PJL0_9COLE|nr:hypothetical protein RN001_004159 [Aquatica leii]